MLKKMMLLASLALAAIAFAVPASASALNWTDEGSALVGNAEDTLVGTADFGDPAGVGSTFGCEVEADVTAEGGAGTGTTGTLTAFRINTEECAGTVAFEKCELVEDSVTNLPRTVHITGTNSIAIAGGIVIHNHFQSTTANPEDCLITSVTLTVGAVGVSFTNSTISNNVSILGGALADITFINEETEQQQVGVFTTAGNPLTGSGTLGVS